MRLDSMFLPLLAIARMEAALPPKRSTRKMAQYTACEPRHDGLPGLHFEEITAPMPSKPPPSPAALPRLLVTG